MHDRPRCVHYRCESYRSYLDHHGFKVRVYNVVRFALQHAGRQATRCCVCNAQPGTYPDHPPNRPERDNLCPVKPSRCGNLHGWYLPGIFPDHNPEPAAGFLFHESFLIRLYTGHPVDRCLFRPDCHLLPEPPAIPAGTTQHRHGVGDIDSECCTGLCGR